MNFLLDFLRLIRLPNLLIIALTQYAIRFGIMYPFLHQAGLDLFLSEKLFGLLVTATVLIAASGYIINDYFDIKLDLVNKPKQLIIGKSISRRQAMFMHLLINVAGVFMSFYVAWSIRHPFLILFQLSSVFLLWFYSVNFKKQLIIGNIIIAALTALVPFTAGYYEIAVMFDEMKELGSLEILPYSASGLGSLLFSIKYLLYWIIGYSAFAFILTLIREIIKDCEDIEGDKAFGCKTYPIVYGLEKAKTLSLSIALLLVVLLAMLETVQFLSKDWISLAYFILLITAPLSWLIYKIRVAQSKKHFFIISQTIKVVMLLGILYTGIIYLF